MWSFCTLFIQTWANPAGIYLFKVNNGNIRKMCLQLTIKIPERRQWSHSGAIVDFQHFSTSFWYFYCWLWKSKCWLGTRSFQNTWFLQFLVFMCVSSVKTCEQKDGYMDKQVQFCQTLQYLLELEKSKQKWIKVAYHITSKFLKAVFHKFY